MEMESQTIRLRASIPSRLQRWWLATPRRALVMRQLESPAFLMPVLFVGAMQVGYAVATAVQ